MEISDEDKIIIERCLKDDVSAFETLFDKYKNSVYSIILRMTGNVNETQDLFQDAFVLIWESLKKFRFECSFSTYIYKIVMNMCINKMKKQKVQTTSLSENINSKSNVSSSIENNELKEQIQKVLNSLPANYRAIIILRYIEDLSYDEISKILNCSISKVKVDLHRARKMFKDKYKLECKPTL